MADPKPSRDGAGFIADELKKDRRRQAEQDKASGTQRAQAVPTLMEQVARLDQTVQRVDEQQQDLLGRLSFSVGSAATVSWSSPVDVTDQNFGPSYSFSLDRPRVVSVTYQLSGFATAHARPIAATAVARLRARIRVDGVVQGVTAHGLFGVTAAYSNGPDSGSVEVGVVGRWVGILSAGGHVVQGAISPFISAASGGTGYVEASEPYLFVDVLQPA